MQGVRLRVDSTCPVSISSFDDPECQRLENDDDTMSSKEEPFNPVIIGGIAAAVVLAVVITVIITFVLVKSCTRTTPTLDHTW